MIFSDRQMDEPGLDAYTPLERAYEEGREAAHARRIHLRQCPYLMGSEEAVEWRRGLKHELKRLALGLEDAQ